MSAVSPLAVYLLGLNELAISLRRYRVVEKYLLAYYLDLYRPLLRLLEA